jgi:Tfp pilus assembly protein PilF
MYRTLDDKGGTAIVLNNFGELARCQGDFRGASEFYEASLALPADTGNIRRRALILGNLGFVTLHLEDAKRAEALLLESLTLKYELQDEIGLSYCFAGLAGVSCELEKFERAAVLLGVVDTLLERTKHQLDLADRHDAERALAAARARPSPRCLFCRVGKGQGDESRASRTLCARSGCVRAFTCQHLS